MSVDEYSGRSSLRDGGRPVAGRDRVDVESHHRGFRERLRFGEDACIGVFRLALKPVDGSLQLIRRDPLLCDAAYLPQQSVLGLSLGVVDVGRYQTVDHYESGFGAAENRGIGFGEYVSAGHKLLVKPRCASGRKNVGDYVGGLVARLALRHHGISDGDGCLWFGGAMRDEPAGRVRERFGRERPPR